MEHAIRVPRAERSPGLESRVAALAAVGPDRRLEDLFDRYERRLRRLIYAMTSDANRVEDVLQDVFIKMHRRLPAQFENERHEAAWVYRVAHRTCLNELRTRRRRRETPGLPEDAVAPTPETGVILRCLESLGPNDRSVVLLVDLVGLDYDAAAAVLGIRRGTVASRLNVARARLRAVLERQGVSTDA